MFAWRRTLRAVMSWRLPPVASGIWICGWRLRRVVLAACPCRRQAKVCQRHQTHLTFKIENVIILSVQRAEPRGPSGGQLS